MTSNLQHRIKTTPYPNLLTDDSNDFYASALSKEQRTVTFDKTPTVG
jgi:hypothetical protein